jgi:hypothetical protein
LKTKAFFSATVVMQWHHMWESEWRLSKLSAGFDGVVETDNEF